MGKHILKWSNYPTEPGVYSIYCARTNRYYIGGSNNIKVRLRKHFSKLRKNEHHIALLQTDFNKYGLKQFRFKVLEITEKHNYKDIEQKYLDKYLEKCPDLIYNICHNTRDSTGFKHTLETKQKLHHTSKNNTNRKDNAEKALINYCHNRNKKYTVVGPDNTIYENIKNLSEFARKFKINLPSLCEVVNGVRPSNKGWTNIDYHINPIIWKPKPRKRKLCKIFNFIAPDGIIYKDIKVLKAFCENHNLIYTNMCALHTGKKEEYLGWRKY